MEGVDSADNVAVAVEFSVILSFESRIFVLVQEEWQ